MTTRLPPAAEIWLPDHRAWLSGFVVDRAAAARERAGFGCALAESAPTTYMWLAAEFTKPLVRDTPFRIGPSESEPSIFLTPEAERAMRFWHCILHLELSAGFQFRDQMRVADHHLGEAEASGRGPGTVPWLLLRAELVGQQLVSGLTGGAVVVGRLGFARTALTAGLPLAVLQAVEEIENRAIDAGDTGRLIDLMVGPREW